MGWTTPKVDFTSNDALGFADVNATNENIDYIRNQIALFNGAKTFQGTNFANFTLKSQKNGSWSTGDSKGEINFYGSDTSGSGVGNHAWIKAVTSNTFGVATDLIFGTTSLGGEATEAMRITQLGDMKVGKGFTADTDTIFQAGTNLDKKGTIGRGSFGLAAGGTNGIFYIGNHDQFTSTNSALWQDQLSATVINAGAGKQVFIKNAGTTNIATFTSESIIFDKPLIAQSTIVREVDTSVLALSGDTSVNLGGNIFLYGGSSTLPNRTIIRGDSTNIATFSLADVIFTVPINTGSDLVVGGEINPTTTTNIGNDLAVAGNINPTTTPTSGTWTNADTGTALPRGVYNVILLLVGASAPEIYQNGVLIMTNTGSTGASLDQRGGTIMSDGTNTTMIIPTGGATIKYWKF